MNLVITVSLISTALALMVGYTYGFYKGHLDGRTEEQKRNARIAGKHMHESIYGPVHGRN